MFRCVLCGAPVQEHQADLTAEGLRCRNCSLQAEVMAHEQAILDRERERQARRAEQRRRQIAVSHAIIWSICALVVHGSFVVMRPWAPPLALVGLGLAVALYLRQRWAWWATMVIDATAALAPMVGGALSERENGGYEAVLAVIPLLLIVDLVRQRRNFGFGTPAAPASATLAPPPRWKAPGRQL
jgi:hypothetical protein